MPFTPFHLGPGAAFKAIGGDRFSFMVFGGSQVLMDIEPLVGILQHKAILHGATHTVLGALVIGVVSGLVGRPVSEAVLKLLKIRHRTLTLGVAFASGFVGTYSHIALDAVMHRDMRPLWPLSTANPLLGVISVSHLHLVCLVLGALGVTVLATKAWLFRAKA